MNKLPDNVVKESLDPRLVVYKYTYNGSADNDFKNDVINGLTSTQKFLFPKYFYDDKGSQLFEKICETDEYYLTRTEASILKKCCGELAEICSDKKTLVELGSGSSIKTKFLLNALLLNYGKINYIPIDVSPILIQSSKQLINTFEWLSISGILSEYEKGLSIINSIDPGEKLIIFLGSSIGNFDFGGAQKFLSMISSQMNQKDMLLVGFDLMKDEDILKKAYNDSQRYTERFNLNLLERINNELGADFYIDQFRHKAILNHTQSRMEMHLESLTAQTVKLDGYSIQFKKGETIHTENSYKFTDEMINEMAEKSGLKINKCWYDDKKYFTLCLFEKSV